MPPWVTKVEYLQKRTPFAHKLLHPEIQPEPGTVVGLDWMKMTTMIDDAVPHNDPTMARWLHALVPRSRHRAGRSHFSHELPADHGLQLFRQQGGSCAISGLPFSLTEFVGVLVKHPFAPSLDRISSQGGYTVDNVRLVCVAVNFGMGQWGEELYLTFARAAVDRSRQKESAIPAASDMDLRPPTQAAAVELERRWFVVQGERIAAAESIATTLSGEARARQLRRIASLKRNLTLGPDGLKAAAAKAALTRHG